MWSHGIVALLAIWFLWGDTAAGPQEQAKTTRARTLLHLIIDGEYADFAAAGDEQVKAAMDAKMAERIWAGITAQMGKYKSEVSTSAKKVSGVVAVNISCRFERGRAILMIALDDADRMAGFRIIAMDRDVPYKPPDYVDRNAFREEKVTVSAGEFPLPGTLTLPKAAGPHPGVVLVHGSGPHDEDETVGANKPFRDLALGLASRGVAVLRYEKRTHKHPMAVKADEWTLDNETIDDAVAAADLLMKRPEIDAKRVFIVGHSQGAFAAPFIAQRDEKLAGIVMLAGNARSILDLIDEQVEYIANVDGPATEEAREQIKGIKESTAAVRAGKTDGVKIFGAPAVCIERIHKLNPVPVASRLKLPILVLQGGRDYQVTKADFAIWKKVLAGHKNVTLKLYEPLNHLFIAGQGPSKPAEYETAGHVDKQVVTDIAEWMGHKAPPSGAADKGRQQIGS